MLPASPPVRQSFSLFRWFIRSETGGPSLGGATASIRLGRSSDWLPFRSLPDPEGSVAEILGTSAEFHSSRTVRDLHLIPFSFPPARGVGNKSARKDTR